MGIKSILDEFLAGQRKSKVHVILTYAQSLDGRIAGKNGLQLRLSGNESMLLTHWMRTRHDAILVGIGTALNDNPQLNARLLPPRSDGQPHPLPRPIILDSNLRLNTNCKLLVNFAEKRGRRPWIFCKNNEDSDLQARKAILEQAGARIFPIALLETGHLSLQALLEALHNQGIASLMVEGGQRIISSFLSANPALVDILIITLAPSFVGRDGVEALNSDTVTPHLEHLESESFGKDMVIAYRLSGQQ